MNKNKQIEINRLLKEGKKTRQISKELHVSLRDVKYQEIKKDKMIPTIPNDTKKKVSKGITKVSRKLTYSDMDYGIPQNKKPFDPSIAAKMIVIFMSYGSQYGKIQDDGSFRHKVRMQNFEEVEDYLTKFTQIEFNYVKTKRLEDLLAKTNKEIAEYNGGN